MKRMTCPHGISPKNNCKECKQEYDRKNMEKYRGRYRGRYNERMRLWRNKNIIHYRNYQREYIQKRRLEVENLLGDKCNLCNYNDEKKKNKGIVFHEIYGKEHSRTYGYILNHLEDFVTLCRKCHSKVHWCVKHLDLSWEQIREMYHD